MELNLTTGFVCFSLFMLSVVLLLITFPVIAKKDLLKWLLSFIQQRTTELSEQEINENNMITFDATKEIKMKKITKNGAIFESKITHGVFARDNFIVFDENKKIWEGNPNSFVIRGENLYKVLTGDTSITIEYEDADAVSHLRNVIGLKNVEIANLQARIKELLASTKKQIVDEHELRKEYTRARFGGYDPGRAPPLFSPFRRFGGYGSIGGGEGDLMEEV